MMAFDSRVLFFLLTALVRGVMLNSHLEDNKLLVILLGGVRWDSMEFRPNFYHLSQTGVRADYLEPVFPATTIPNLYTVMTGLYPASHGQTGDYMYDVERNVTFSGMHDLHTDSAPRWWQKGDPFWVNVMRQKKNAYMYRWPGCDVFIHGIKPTFCKPIGDWMMSPIELRDSLNESLQLFTNNSADFIGVYYNGLQQAAHNWGQSAHLSEATRDVDDIISNLLTEVDKTSLPGDPGRHLSDVVNIMVVSDHGNTHISPIYVINMTSILKTPDVHHYISDGSTLQIWPSHNAIDTLYITLNNSQMHYTSWSLGHMPPDWHYMKGPFVPPILLLADPGYTFQTPTVPKFPVFTHSGEHHTVNGGWGYLNTFADMHGIFYARGPHFKKGAIVPGFSNVHLYQVMCAVLGVDMSSNDGSWSVVANMLVAAHVPHRYTFPSHKHTFVTSLIVLTLLFCLVSGACALWCRRESIKKWYNNRSIKWQPLHDGVI